MLGLAHKLKQRGHDVLLLTNDYFAPQAEKYEIPFEPLGTAQEYLNCIQDPLLWHPQKSFQHVYKFLQPALKRQHAFLVEQASAGPIVCLSSCLGFGARMAHDSHNIPVVTVHLQPSVIWSDIVPPKIGGLSGPRWFQNLMFRVGEKFAVDGVVCPFLNSWRRELGLPPVRKITRWWNSPTGVLCLFPEWFAPPQRDWPQPLIQTNFPLWNEGSEQPLNGNVEQFLQAGTPPIVFTPGTANVHGADFFAAAAKACRNLNRRGIFLTKHPEQLPTGLPESIRHISYVPLDLLLPRSAAFVHHGGIGSTSQALMAGIPHVVMPLAHDQFDNADRVKRLNVGQSLPVKQFTEDNLTRSLEELLNSSAVAEACKTISTRLTPEAGVEQSTLEIERRFC